MYVLYRINKCGIMTADEDFNLKSEKFIFIVPNTEVYMSNSVTEEESVPIDEAQLFDWACSDVELLNLEAFLSRATRSQRKEIVRLYEIIS